MIDTNQLLGIASGKEQPDRIKSVMSAEFDLATGQVKHFRFEDRDLVRWEEETPRLVR